MTLFLDSSATGSTLVEFDQGPLRVGPRVQGFIPRPRTPEEKDVIDGCVCPHGLGYRGAILTPEPIGLNGPPNPGKTHGVAKRMDKNHGEKRAIPEVEKGGVNAKKIGVGEL